MASLWNNTHTHTFVDAHFGSLVPDLQIDSDHDAVTLAMAFATTLNIVLASTMGMRFATIVASVHIGALAAGQILLFIPLVL